MRKFLLILLVVFSVALGWNWSQDENRDETGGKPKTEILRVGLVSDSENENDLLEKALLLAKGRGVNFVIGLGDWSSVGTIEQLSAAKNVFDASGLEYYLIPGDHDLWSSRNEGSQATYNFRQVFGAPSQVIEEKGVQFVLLDNSDIYTGIKDTEISNLKFLISKEDKLTFVLAHKTPFHPQSAHVMGEDNEDVAKQAEELVSILEENDVDGFFSGDLHFFAQFNLPNESVKITTIGAVNRSRNFQGPRFSVLKIFDDYTWVVEDIAIK